LDHSFPWGIYKELGMKSKLKHIKVILHIALVCLAIFLDNLNLGILI
jgi:hypothetical protein